MTEGQAKRGPKPDTLKIEGDWQEAVKKALRKPPPRPERRDREGKDEEPQDNG